MIHAKNGEPHRGGHAKNKAKTKRPHGREREVDYQPIGKDNTSHEEVEAFNKLVNK